MHFKKLATAATAAALAAALATPAATAQSSQGSSMPNASALQDALQMSSQLSSTAPGLIPGGQSTNRQVLSLSVGGQQREFILHVPADYTPGRALPVIFGFGGMDNTAAFTEGYMGFEKAADALVVYPQQLSTGAHAGWEGPHYGPAAGTDVAFVRAILDYLNNAYTVDSSQVFAAGLSNGGGMALRLACRAPELFAAVAGVATAGYTPVFDGCAGGVDTLLIHGTADGSMSYDHGGSNAWGGAYYSARRTFREVGLHNSCEVDHPAAQPVADGTKFTFRGCRADTTLYRVDGGAHTWLPGSTARIWDYFSNPAR